MSQQPASFNKHADSENRDGQRTPFLAMWYQTRAALAELLIPVLAGLKVVWLIAFSPTRFFKAELEGSKKLTKLRSPFDVIWRALTPEERTPLDGAKFLFFGILTAVLAGFGFDNTNRLSGMVDQLGARDWLTQQIPALAQAALRLRLFSENETVQAIQAFLDRDLIAGLIEFIATLFITMLFAYLFRLVAGRQISATSSYSFWLYMTGMRFFTTALTFVFFMIFSLPVINLPQFTPELVFLIVEYGWLILWFYVLPLIILPRIFQDLTVRRTLLALLVTHGVFMVIGWLFRAGFTTLILFWSTLFARF
jgi:hypothetical protein